MSISTRVLYFDNLGALEAHLQGLLADCKDSADEYRELLGEYLRKRQGQKEEDQWSQEISQALSGNPAGPAEKKDAKEKKGGMFGGGKQKEKGGMFGSQPKKEKGSMFGGGKQKAPADWVSFDPFAVFVGQESKGVAELYFEAINSLDEMAKKTEVALSTLGTLKGKAASAGNVSAVVSFINGVPVKVILKQTTDGQKKRKKMEFSFTVPVVRSALPQVLPL